MLTKGAIGNLINRYRAVLKKCHLLNTFGSLAVASMLVLGGAGAAAGTAPEYQIYQGDGTEASLMGGVFLDGNGKTLTMQATGGHVIGGQHQKTGLKNFTSITFDGTFDSGFLINSSDAVVAIDNVGTITQTEGSYVDTFISPQYGGEFTANVGSIIMNNVGNAIYSQTGSTTEIIASGNVEFATTYDCGLVAANNLAPNKADEQNTLSITAENITLTAKNGTAVQVDSYEWSPAGRPYAETVGKNSLTLSADDTIDIDARVAVSVSDGNGKYAANATLNAETIKLTGSDYSVWAEDDAKVAIGKNEGFAKATISGDVSVAKNSFVDINLGTGSLTGNIAVDSTSIFTVAGNEASINGSIDNAGTINIASGSTTIGGSIAGSGALNIADDATLALNADTDGGVVTVDNNITNAGTIHVADSALLTKPLASNNGKITGDTGSTLTINVGNNPSNAPLDTDAGKSLTISGLDTLNILGNSTSKNGIVSQGTMDIDVNTLNIGTEETPSQFFSVIHALGGTIDIDAKDVNVHSGGESIIAQSSGDITVNATNDVNLHSTDSHAVASSIFNASGDGNTTLKITAGNKFTAESDEWAGLSSMDSYNGNTYAGTTSLEVSGAKGVDISSKGDGIYVVNVNRSYTGTSGDVKSTLKIESSAGDINITGEGGTVRMRGVREDAEVVGSITAKEGTVTIASADQFGINLENAELTIEAKDVNISGGSNAIELTNKGTVTINASGTIDIDGNIKNVDTTKFVINANGGTIDGDIDFDHLDSSIAFGSGNGVINGKVAHGANISGDADITINGGEQVALHSCGVFNIESTAGKVTINSDQAGAINISSGALDIKAAGDVTIASKADDALFFHPTVGNMPSLEAEKHNAVIESTGGSVKLEAGGDDAFALSTNSAVTITAQKDIDLIGKGRTALSSRIVTSNGKVIDVRDSETVTSLEAKTGSVNITSNILEANVDAYYKGAVVFAEARDTSITAGQNITIADTGDRGAGKTAIELINKAALTLNAGGNVAITGSIKGAEDTAITLEKGALSVESGALSGFKGSYTQTAGSTDIRKASDFFGGSVNIEAGSLTVGASQFGTGDAASAFASEVLDASFGDRTTLVVDLADIDKTTYTLSEYKKAQAALLDAADKATLSFGTATLEKGKNDALVLGGNIDSYGSITVSSGTLAYVGEGVSAEEALKHDALTLEAASGDMVNLVGMTDTTHAAINANNITLAGSESAPMTLNVKGLTVASADNLSMQYANVTFNGSVVADADGKDIPVSVTVGKGASLTTSGGTVEDVLVTDASASAKLTSTAVKSSASVNGGTLDLLGGSSTKDLGASGGASVNVNGSTVTDSATANGATLNILAGSSVNALFAFEGASVSVNDSTVSGITNLYDSTFTASNATLGEFTLFGGKGTVADSTFNGFVCVEDGGDLTITGKDVKFVSDVTNGTPIDGENHESGKLTVTASNDLTVGGDLVNGLNGEMTLTAANAMTFNGDVENNGKLTMSAANINIDASTTVEGEKNAALCGTGITSVTASGDIALKSNTEAAVFMAGKLDLTAGGNVTIEGVNTSAIYVGGEEGSYTNISGKNIAITGDIEAFDSNAVTLAATEKLAISGKLYNEGTLTINAGSFELTNSHLCGGGVFDINATGDIALSGDKKPVINTEAKIAINAGGNLTITGTKIDTSKLDEDDFDEVGFVAGRNVAILTSENSQSFTAGKDLNIDGDVLFFNGGEMTLTAGNDVTINGTIANRPKAVGASGSIADDGGNSTISGKNVAINGDIWNVRHHYLEAPRTMTITAEEKLSIKGNVDSQSALNIKAGSLEFSGGYFNFDGYNTIEVTTGDAIIGDGSVAPIVAGGNFSIIANNGTVVINGGPVLDKEIIDDVPEVSKHEKLAILAATVKFETTDQSISASTLEINGGILAIDQSTVALESANGSINGNILTMDSAKVTMDGAFTMDGAIAEGSDVVVSSGSLTVDAAKLGTEGEASAVTTGIKSSLTVTADGILNVDFAGLDNITTYTAEQYNAAKAALFDEGDKGKLLFLNAKLDESGTNAVLGAEQSEDKKEVTITTTPVAAGSGMSADEAQDTEGTEIKDTVNTVVKIVDSSDEKHGLLSPEKVTLGEGASFTAQSMQVGEAPEDGVKVEISGGAEITFTGGTGSSDGSIIVDASGSAVDTSVAIDKESSLTVGVESNTEKQNAKFKEVKVEGKHKVNGNGHDKTSVSYDKLEVADGGDVEIKNASVKVKKEKENNGLHLGQNSALKVLHSAVNVAHMRAQGGKLFLDPAYFEAATLAEGDFNSALVVGEGSVAVLGSVEGLKDAVEDAGFVTEKKGDGFTVKKGAVLALGQSVKLGTTGSLVVNGTVDKAEYDKDPTKYAPADGSALFAGDSLLVVQAGATLSGKTIEVAPEAKLSLVGLSADMAGTKVTDFESGTIEGWSDDNLKVSRLFDVEVNAENGDLVIEKVEASNLSEALPGVIAVNALTEMVESSKVDEESATAGIAFLSRAVHEDYMPDSAKAVDVINEVSRAAVTAGVQNTSLRIADTASNTVLGHMSLTDSTASVHADGVDFWAAPMYGNLYTNGMVASGSSVRGQFGGLALGADLEAGQFLGGKFRLGAAINGGGGQSETKGNATSTQNDYDFGGLNLYAGWNSGALNIIGSVGYGFGNHEVAMSLPSTMGMGSAKADIDTTVFTADLRAEYQLKTDWMDVLPHAGVRYTALRTDAHDLEVGGSVLNSVKSDTQNIVQFPIGVTLSKDFTCSGWNVKPMVDVSVIPAAGDKEATTKVNFSGLDAWDSVNTRIMDSTSWAGTVGVQAEKGSMTFGLNYGVQASSNETDQNIQVKFGWKF